MCTDKPHLGNQQSQLHFSIVKTEQYPPEITSDPFSSSDNSPTSGDGSDIIEFGPIKVKPRKSPAPTLATGRRSKYEMLSPEDEQKRELRRARNRAAAERVRLSRMNVEQQLQEQIDGLKDQEQKLSINVQMLQNHKLQLEARLLTHAKLCATTSASNTVNNPTPIYASHRTPTFQPIEQVSEFNFDELFSHPSSLVQTQQDTVSNLLTTIIPDNEFDDILMDL